MKNFEQLGSFYIGRKVDETSGETLPEAILYDAKDLTTHAVCIGMTGSGKTGLAITLLEEAAIDGIPILAIDPKGDLGNLLLSFPKLAPSDFEPWVDEASAERKGRTVSEQAEWTAELWRNGLKAWDQEPDRIRRFAESSERHIYTPCSRAGEPIALLHDFAAPPAIIVEDAEAFSDKINAAVSGLLGLLEIDADPTSSREAILLARIFDDAWRAGETLDLVRLIRAIQEPPFEQVGVFDLESFFSSKERFAFAMQLNNLLASPALAAWTEGEPLDIQRLLYGTDGRPQLSIVSIAHLDERERMFFVAKLLNEFVAWTRAQSGTSSLRAILYMDEVFGFLPPTANPPSKQPMLTLLKQARAYGVGVVMSTQNPVDLDYKALSNIGTWWLGRLQTERDKDRVLDGLEGFKNGLTRSELSRQLSSLKSRVFLQQNVHDDAPILMHSRWALSYLSGPMTRQQIQRVCADNRPPAAPAQAQAKVASTRGASASATTGAPMLPPAIPQKFAVGPATENPRYLPTIAARATLHHANARLRLDEWSQIVWIAYVDSDPGAQLWADAFPGDPKSVWAESAVDGAVYEEADASASQAKSYKLWKKQLKSALYANCPLTLHRCRRLKLIGAAGETEGEFRQRVQEQAREQRDAKLEKLRGKFAPKLARLEERISNAELAVEAQEGQVSQRKTDTAISIGATMLGALFGRKLASVGNVRRAGSAARSARRISKEKSDVARAEMKLSNLQVKLEELEADLVERLDELRESFELDQFEIEVTEVAPRKSDIQIDELCLLWLPQEAAP